MKNLLHSRKQRTTVKKHLRRWKIYLAFFIALSIFSYIVVLGTLQFAKQLFSMRVYAPTHEVYAQEKPKPISSEHDQIVEYINEVFGDDAPKAFQLLSCENKSLNPNAVNTAGNSPAGSRDIGVFQINEFWQKTQGKFLFNWKINIEVAHQLYVENGNSFKLWSCSRKVGLN